jgi:hypothetical protein
MDNNRDWKLIVALALAGLALLIAISGPRGRADGYVGAAPQQIIVQPAAPTGGTTAPVVTVPGAYTGVSHTWGSPGGWGGGHHFSPFFPLLFFGGLIFLAFWLFGRSRHRWGGPSGYGVATADPGVDRVPAHRHHRRVSSTGSIHPTTHRDRARTRPMEATRRVRGDRRGSPTSRPVPMETSPVPREAANTKMAE